MLVAVIGLPGTGKSTLAAKLAEQLKKRKCSPAVLRTDVVRRRILKRATLAKLEVAEDPLTYDIERVFFGKRIPAKWQALIWHQKQRVYDAFFLEAERLAEKGKDVILDATFYKKEDRLRAKKIAEGVGTKFFLVECVCPQNVAIHRLSSASRTRAVSNALRAAYFKVKAAWQLIREKHFVVNTAGPLKEARENAALLAQAIAREEPPSTSERLFGW